MQVWRCVAPHLDSTGRVFILSSVFSSLERSHNSSRPAGIVPLSQQPSVFSLYTNRNVFADALFLHYDCALA